MNKHIRYLLAFILIAGVVSAYAAEPLIDLGMLIKNFLNSFVSVTGMAVPTCTDSDGGKVYTVRGTARGKNGNYADSCYNTAALREYYCKSNGYVGYVYYTCLSGYKCYSGACIRNAMTTTTRPTTIPTTIGLTTISSCPTQCGAWSSVSHDCSFNRCIYNFVDKSSQYYCPYPQKCFVPMSVAENCGSNQAECEQRCTGTGCGTTVSSTTTIRPTTTVCCDFTTTYRPTTIPTTIRPTTSIPLTTVPTTIRPTTTVCCDFTTTYRPTTTITTTIPLTTVPTTIRPTTTIPLTTVPTTIRPTTSIPLTTVRVTTTVVSGCTDSDGGQNYGVAGTVSKCSYSGCSYYTDSCYNAGALKEYFCSGGTAYSTYYTCTSGTTCSGGACRKTATTVPPVPTTVPQV